MASAFALIKILTLSMVTDELSQMRGSGVLSSVSFSLAVSGSYSNNHLRTSFEDP